MTRRHWHTYFSRPLITIMFLGFSSGLPLALTGATLAYWLADSNVDKTTIGILGSVATPYALKFLWSPAIDSLPIPALTRLLGRRRGWMLLTQCTLAGAILFLASLRPEATPLLVGIGAIMVAFTSASQDIVIDAYRVERLTPETQGQGAAMAQLGYQMGIIAAGFGALHFASSLGWQKTYIIMAGLTGVGIVTTLLCQEPVLSIGNAITPRPTFKDSVIAPFADLMRRPHWSFILLFIVVYKLADAFLGRMTSPFFHDMHFAKEDIANIVKFYGTIATLSGVFVGGVITQRFGPLRILFLAGLLHAGTNLLYIEQARLGADTHFLAVSIAVENFTSGISSAAFVAYLSNLCNIHYTGTQYALLSSLAALGRTWLATPAGWVEQLIGWQYFFMFSALLALPGLLLLVFLNKRLKPTSLPAAAT